MLQRVSLRLHTIQPAIDRRIAAVHCAYTPYNLPLTGVQLQSRQSMGLPRANLNSPRGPHSQGNQWLCPSNTFCLLCSLHAAVTPRSFQSQNAYCNSEKSSLHWKYKFKNVGDSKNAFLHCRDVLALSKSCVCCAAAGKARRGPPGALPHAKGPDSKGKSQGVPIEGSFSFLCLHAAVALTPLLPKAHC